MLDIDGFLTSQDFLTQLAIFISAIFSAIVNGFFGQLLGLNQ